MKAARPMSRFASLTFADWSLLVQAALLVWVTGMLLHFLSLKRLRWLAAAIASPFALVNRRRPVPAGRIAWAVAAAARRSIFGSTCLTKAIAGQALFSSFGYRTKLRVGGKRVDGAFEAHAWLELNDDVLLGGPRSVTAQYTPFLNLDEATL